MKTLDARRIPALLAATVLAACASNPPAQAPEAAPAAISAPAPAVAAASAGNAETPKMFGYRRKVQNGEEFFCKNEGVIGSRVKVIEVCLTQAQMQAVRDKSQDDLRRMQNPGTLMPDLEQPPAGQAFGGY